VFFNEQDNLHIFLSKTNLLKHSNGKHLYIGIWQHSKYFCSTFQGVGFDYHQINVRSQSRTSTSRSRLFWQSLGLGGYGLDYITGRNIANAKDEPNPNLNPNCSTDDNFVDIIPLCSMNKILKMKISDGIKVFS